MVTVGNIASVLFEWAPLQLAWERDNVGLLVGDASSEVRHALVTLDCTSEIIDEALEKGCSLIISHHPVMFLPTKRVLWSDPEGRLIGRLIQNGISLIAMHTNADAASGGVNTALARRLGLQDAVPLAASSIPQSSMRLVLTATGWQRVRPVLSASNAAFHALADDAGGWVVELPAPPASVHATLDGLGIDTSCILHTTRSLHPHGAGLGAVGMLPAPMPATLWLDDLCSRLSCTGVRATRHEPDRPIHRVAVCGGAGRSMIADAIRAGADAFVTADLSYHDFQDHRDAIILVDAGHFETEQVFIDACRSHLVEHPTLGGVMFHPTTITTNPISCHVSKK